MRRAAGIALCLLAGCGLFPELEYLSTCREGCGGTAGAATAGRGGNAGTSGDAGRAGSAGTPSNAGTSGAAGAAGIGFSGAAGMASGAAGSTTGGAAGTAAQGGAAGNAVGGAGGNAVGGGAGVGGTAGGGAASGGNAGAPAGSGGAGAGGSGAAGKGGASGAAGGNGGANSGGSGGAGGGAVACPSGRGPTMVRLPKNLGGGCIDSTEVTFSQYQQFIVAPDVDPTDQPAECALNTGLLAFRPTEYIYSAYKANAGGGTGYADTAVSGVDWCDARAFCAWAGKKLCGKVGGGALPAAQRSTAADAWWLACATQEGKTYPYGGLTIGGTVRPDVYDKTLCTTEVTSTAEIRQSARKITCEGGVPGVYDLSGNLLEWTDSCVPGVGGQTQTDQCALRGGSFNYDGSSVKCSFSQNADRVRPEQTDVKDPNGLYYSVFGFRCCSE